MATRRFLSLLFLGAWLSTAELVRTASPTVGAVLLVALGAIVAAIASAPSPASIGLGALAAVAYGTLRPQLPVAAWAVFAVLVLAGRGLRARGSAAMVLHGALAMLGGALAMWISLLYVDGDLATRIAALVVGAVLLGMPLLIPVDDPLTASMLSLASRSRGPSRTRLLRAVALARRVERSEDASSGDRRMLTGVFTAVHRAALRAERRSSRELDEALTDQLGAISRFLRALGHRGDATLGLETRGDVSLSIAREAVEVEARTLRELAG